MGDLVKPVDRIVALVERLIGPPIDQAGAALADLVGIAGADKLHAIRERRKKNLDAVLDKTDQIIQEAKIDVQPVPLKLLEQIVSKASLEDDGVLQNLWAALLANASSPENSS